CPRRGRRQGARTAGRIPRRRGRARAIGHRFDHGRIAAAAAKSRQRRCLLPHLVRPRRSPHPAGEDAAAMTHARDSARRTLACAAGTAGVMLAIAALAQTTEPRPFALTPSEMSWMSQGPLAAPGMEQFNLVGDPARPGPYTLRLKFPKGLRIAPHAHPDSRE